MSASTASGAAPSTPQGSGTVGLPSFPVVRRGGYDKAAVDQFVAQFQAGETEASAQARAAEEQNRRLSARVAELEHQISEQGNPTYSGLGAHAAGDAPARGGAGRTGPGRGPAGG